MADDPHAVLGVPSTATAQQISEAYRALVQIYHPDRYAEAPPRVKEEALRRMQAVNAAYESLGKPSVKPPPNRRPNPQPAQPRPGARSRTASPPPPRPPRAAPRQERPRATPRQERPSSTPMTAVLYVDGSPHFHDAAVAPLGLDLRAEPVRPAANARRCPTLDDELGRWFQAQTRNASMTDKLMYAAWDETQRALYTATLGCSEVLLDSVAKFGAPCVECRPA